MKKHLKLIMLCASILSLASCNGIFYGITFPMEFPSSPAESTPSVRPSSPTDSSTIIDSSSIDNSTPIVSSPIESTPIESFPIESSPIESSPVESSPIESSPIESSTVESSPIESTPIESEFLKVETLAENGSISLSTNSNINVGDEIEVYFKPDTGYILLSYTVFDDNGRTQIPAYGHNSAKLTIASDTSIVANYGKLDEYTMFNYCSGNSKIFYYVDGQYQNSKGTTKYSYEDVISSIKDENGNSIDSSIFTISPITTMPDGKWVNLYYTNKNYGLSLYSNSLEEHSGIKFESKTKIHSITVTYYSYTYSTRSLIESGNNELTPVKITDETYSYFVDNNEFTITNISDGNYLYIPSIEIVYSTKLPEKEPFTITFDANGGEGTMSPQTVISSEFNLDENKFSKLGYTFIGWATTPSGDVVYRDGESISDSINSDTTLYAIYEFDASKAIELVKEYNKTLPTNIDEIYAYYGGNDEHDITKYISNFDSNLADSFELQFGKIVYVGTSDDYYNLVTSNFIPVSQSYKAASEISLLDAYLELAYLYYYQGTQIQYDQGSSYQRKIRNMVPEDATELYQKYMDCSTFVSNSFYNAFDNVVVQNSDINSITTKVLINYARDNSDSNEVILYQDNLLTMTDSEKQEALTKFKNTIQPGDLYVYRHGSDSAGHVMLYIGDGYFLHSTGSSYNYSSYVDKVENYTSVQGVVNPEGSVRYQTAASTVYKSSSTRYLFYIDPDGTDSNDRYAILRPLNRTGLKLSSTAIARCMASGLDIEKSADKTTSVSLGDTITYTIKIKNNSNKAISNISITDSVPSYTTFSSMSKSYYNHQNGSDLIWNIPTINSNETISVSYSVVVTSSKLDIGKNISSTAKVGHIDTNTLNISISSLSESQLKDFVSMALQYYDNSNVSYSDTANNSTADPTSNEVTFNNGANFVTALYKRYYESLGQSLDISSELSTITNTNFMSSIISSDGVLQTQTKLYSMMVNGGYGGTYFTKDYYMDRMRTVECEYLLPGDIISFSNTGATNQYLYLGDVKIGSSSYNNALLLFTTSDGVKLIHGASADALLVKFIGYKCFAVIRPSLYL